MPFDIGEMPLCRGTVHETPVAGRPVAYWLVPLPRLNAHCTVPSVRNPLQQHNFSGLQFVAAASLQTILSESVACQSHRTARSPDGNEAGATFSLGSDQAARPPLLLAALPEKALSRWVQRADATRVNKPENDDPSIVEPIEITTPLAHSQYAKNGKTLTMPRKERAQRGVRRPHARAYSRTLYEGSRYGAHYTAKIKCVGSGMLTKFDPRPNESQQFKLPKSLSSKARRVQYH
jgi:hypothetical protein